METEIKDNFDKIEEVDLLFDEDWIKEAICEEKSYSRFYKSSVNKIVCYSLFIDISQNIIKLERQYIKPDINNIISQTQILEIIKNDTKEQLKNFRIEHILSFNLDIEPVLINEFINQYDINKIKKLFLKEISYTSDIKFNDTIHYFNSLNTLILIYKQKTSNSKFKKNNFKNKNKSKKVFLFKNFNNKTKKR